MSPKIFKSLVILFLAPVTFYSCSYACCEHSIEFYLRAYIYDEGNIVDANRFEFLGPKDALESLNLIADSSFSFEYDWNPDEIENGGRDTIWITDTAAKTNFGTKLLIFQGEGFDEYKGRFSAKFDNQLICNPCLSTEIYELHLH